MDIAFIDPVQASGAAPLLTVRTDFVGSDRTDFVGSDRTDFVGSDRTDFVGRFTAMCVQRVFRFHQLRRSRCDRR